jgi:mannose-1-phosphate guanylyltransferase
MKAIILAGGLGTRLQPYTFFIPKPMLPLGNKPLLEHIIDWLKNSTSRGPKGGRIDHIILCVSYLHRSIEDYFEDGGRFGIKIEYARADRPLATAGQLKTAEKMLDETFVCVYGDSVYEFALDKMIYEHRQSNAFISMALLPYKTNLKYGFIEMDGKDDRVSRWIEKPEVSGLINIGCYIMEPAFLKLIPRLAAYGMDDAVRKALEQEKLVRGFKIDSGFIDIGDKKNVKKLGKI